MSRKVAAERLMTMTLPDEIDELDEQDADEPLTDEADALLSAELELPLELLGVPFN
jgi:hypothetical protein